jgi:Protein of unknown function (DUF3303)
MKYIAIWTLPHGTFNAVIKRFMETGGAPPKGVKILGRWHGMSGQGVAIAESEDTKAMFEWRTQWADLLEMTITPCLEDADAGAVLASMAAR